MVSSQQPATIIRLINAFRQNTLASFLLHSLLCGFHIIPLLFHSSQVQFVTVEIQSGDGVDFALVDSLVEFGAMPLARHSVLLVLRKRVVVLRAVKAPHIL